MKFLLCTALFFEKNYGHYKNWRIDCNFAAPRFAGLTTY